MLYVLAMWGGGISQGLLWLSLDDFGEVKYSFIEVMEAMSPYYLLRLLGGLLFLTGAVLMAVNLFRTMFDGQTVRVRPPPVAAESGGH